MSREMLQALPTPKVDGTRTAAEAVAAATGPTGGTWLASFPGPGVFVWGTWALLLLAAVYLIQSYGSPVPLWDDYLMFPQLTGAEPVTPGWLWEIHYGHRIPLDRLVQLCLGRISHYNMLSGMYFNLFVLAALAALFIRAAKALRGRISYADAFIPLLLLHYGHHRQLLWFWQICYLVPVLLYGVVFYLILRNANTLSFRSAVVAGICLPLLPLCGAMGLLFAPGLALWLGYGGWRAWSSGDRQGRRTALAVLASVAATFLLVALYFYHYTGDRQPAGAGTARQILRSTLQFLSTGLGNLPEGFFPFHLFPATGLVVGALLLLGALAFPLLWRYHPQGRLRVWGVLMFAGCEVLQALAVGYGRSGPGWDVDEALNSRYVTLAVFALLCLYFIWCLFPFPSVGGFFQVVLFTLACGLIPLNVKGALEEEGGIRSKVQEFDRDMEAGVPPALLTDRYWSWVYWLDDFRFKHARMAQALVNLHDAGAAHFRPLRTDLEFEEIPLPLRPSHAEGISGDLGTGAQVAGPGAFIELSLPEPRFVYGVRVQMSFPSQAVDYPVTSRLAWAGPGTVEGVDPGRQDAMSSQVPWDNTARPPAPRLLTLAFWVNEPISRFRFFPSDRPNEVRIHEVRLLVPPGAAR